MTKEIFVSLMRSVYPDSPAESTFDLLDPEDDAQHRRILAELKIKAND